METREGCKEGEHKEGGKQGGRKKGERVGNRKCARKEGGRQGERKEGGQKKERRLETGSVRGRRVGGRDGGRKVVRKGRGRRKEGGGLACIKVGTMIPATFEAIITIKSSKAKQDQVETVLYLLSPTYCLPCVSHSLPNPSASF